MAVKNIFSSEYIADDEPRLSDILNISDADTNIVIFYDNQEYAIPAASIELMVNGRTASPGTLIGDGADITYKKTERQATTVSEALAAVNFQPPAANSRMTFTILVNGQSVEFTSPIKNGDILEVKLTPLDKPAAPIENEPTPQEAAKPHLSIADFIRHD